MRKSKIERNTFETKIKVELNIDGTGEYENNTGVGFLTCLQSIVNLLSFGKIIFVGLISLFSSINLFSVIYNFEKNAKNKLETIETEYLQSNNDDKKRNF